MEDKKFLKNQERSMAILFCFSAQILIWVTLERLLNATLVFVFVIVALFILKI